MSTRRVCLVFASSLAVFSLSSSPSHAQSTANGFALDRFNPSERGSEWFEEDSLDLRDNGDGKARGAAGLVGEWAYRPLVLYNPDGTVRAVPVENQLILHPGASITLWSRLRLAFDLPIAVYEQGTTGTVGTQTFLSPSSSAGVGDLRLSADFRLLGQYGDPFRLAAGAQVFVPVGDQAGYLSDGSVRILIPRLMVAGDVSWFSYAAHVAFNYRGDQDSFGGTSLGSEFVFGASAGVHAADKKLLIGPEVYGSSVVTNGNAFSTATTPLEAALGAHYLVADTVRLGAGAGMGLTRGYGEPAARVLLSVEWAPSPPPPPPPPVQEPAPAPPPPPPPPPADRDNDGIPDAEDACPDVAGVHTDDPKTNGCPPDRDKDGIPDAEDACPDVPGVHTDDPKTNGCPSDRDKDGIPDTEDACPDAPGPANPDPKKNGCPVAAVVGQQIVITEQVKFATGSAKILPDSDTVLNAVLDVLNKHPEIKHVRVEGHTDNVGKPAMNKTLSTKRAAAVVDWLVKHGIDKSRMTSQGFGMERPIDTNDTPEGRQNNRRVEFHIESEKAPAP